MANWQRIEDSLKNLVRVLHEELGWFGEEELQNTPGRITRFYKEWVENENVKITSFVSDFAENGNQLVIFKDITFYSMCSHHMLPFYGKAHVAYLASERVLGASKIIRIVSACASKPQLQEKMTNEIAEMLINADPYIHFAMVICEATHMCMTCRGVKQPTSKMVTSALRWDDKYFKEKGYDWKTIKNEVLLLIRGG